VPLLVEVLKEEGKYEADFTKKFDERQEELKKEFTEKRGVLVYVLGGFFQVGSRVLRGVFRV
jgi:hypothetical protein